MKSIRNAEYRIKSRCLPISKILWRLWWTFLILVVLCFISMPFYYKFSIYKKVVIIDGKETEVECKHYKNHKIEYCKYENTNFVE